MKEKKTPTIRLVIGLFIMAIACYIASRFLWDYCGWASNTLISIACGILTGIALYVLSNMRNVTQEKYKEECIQLIDIKCKVYELYSDARYFEKYHSLYSNEIDCDDFFKKTLEGAQEVCDDLCKLPKSLFDELEIDVENSDLLDMSAIENAYQNIQDLDDVSQLSQLYGLLSDISDKMAQINEKLKKPINQRKNILARMRKYPV